VSRSSRFSMGLRCPSPGALDPPLETPTVKVTHSSPHSRIHCVSWSPSRTSQPIPGATIPTSRTTATFSSGSIPPFLLRMKPHSAHNPRSRFRKADPREFRFIGLSVTSRPALPARGRIRSRSAQPGVRRCSFRQIPLGSLSTERRPPPIARYRLSEADRELFPRGCTTPRPVQDPARSGRSQRRTGYPLVASKPFCP
jgi:hypothetical protein